MKSLTERKALCNPQLMMPHHTIVCVRLLFSLSLASSLLLVTACLARPSAKETKPMYALIEIPAGEGASNYLLLEMKMQDSKIVGRGFFLSNMWDPVPTYGLSLKDVVEHVGKGHGSCVGLTGSENLSEMSLETEELRKEYKRVRWRYKWRIKTSLKQDKPVWQVHQDYWFDPYGHFPRDFSVASPLLKEIPGSLGERKDCQQASSPR